MKFQKRYISYMLLKAVKVPEGNHSFYELIHKRKVQNVYMLFEQAILFQIHFGFIN